MSVMNRYQPLMSKARWRAAPGRKLSFLVTHGDQLLGLICLVSPMLNITCLNDYLGLADTTKAERGFAFREHMMMSVCVGAQPISWYWNVGKLCALIAPTLGDCIEQRYSDDEFKGVITTSLNGRGSQYNRIYEWVGLTEGYGHEHIDDARYQAMLAEMQAEGVDIPSCKFGSGSNARMRRIQAYAKAFPERAGDVARMKHGIRRGVYYHDAVDPATRQDVIQHWYDRWGRPRYERKKDETAPYQSGLQTAEA
jgi:hypothetical protein